MSTPDITVTVRTVRDIAIDVPGACHVRCLGDDAFARAARLLVEVEEGADWPLTAGAVQRVRTGRRMPVHSEGPNRANGRAL